MHVLALRMVHFKMLRRVDHTIILALSQLIYILCCVHVHYTGAFLAVQSMHM